MKDAQITKDRAPDRSEWLLATPHPRIRESEELILRELPEPQLKKKKKERDKRAISSSDSRENSCRMLHVLTAAAKEKALRPGSRRGRGGEGGGGGTLRGLGIPGRLSHQEQSLWLL